MAESPVYIVHLSCADALNQVRQARDRGIPAFAETCPQYLFLSLDNYDEPGFDGAKYVMTPPLREKQNQDELWKGLKMDDLQVISTDHCPFCMKEQKELGSDDFTKIPNGAPGVENRMPLIYNGGVVENRISLNRFVELTSTAAAKMFGLFPKKGTIAVGSDADIVIFDPEKEQTLSVKTSHMNFDYNAYEGKKIKGVVETVLSRGKVVVENGDFKGKAGDGQFLKRGTCVAGYFEPRVSGIQITQKNGEQLKHACIACSTHLLCFSRPRDRDDKDNFPASNQARLRRNSRSQPQQARPQPSPAPEEPPVVTRHEIRVGGSTIKYTATAGMMPIKNRDGEVEARMFFTSYVVDGPDGGPRRPLTFSFNGGPGSASVWLHMGAIGPKRVKMNADGTMPAPPYQLVDNEGTWLTKSDLVFIDPVGTGYSRPARPDLGTKFFGLQGDIESVGEFIRLYLTRYERWTSPLFLAGESYGTTRASALSGYLIERGIAFNGIMLISTIMNFGTTSFAAGNDLPYALFLPSYAATAWYHKKLPSDLQSKPVNRVVAEAEAWASGEYMLALGKGGA